MPYFLQVFIFFFGAIIGSFLNAVVWRLRTKESFVNGRSYCPHCRHTLSVLDLVPIFSYVFLCGKCRYCSASISIQYLLVEVVVGTFFLLAGLVIAPVGTYVLTAEMFANLLLNWYVISVLTIVFLYDFKYMLILRSVTLPASVIVFTANIFLGVKWYMLLLGILASAGFFWLQRVVSRGRWIGGGDVHLGILMGATLGFPYILVALLLSYLSGSLVGLSLMAIKKSGWKSELPFGTFLSVATVITLLYGDKIIKWYFSLL